MKKSVTALAMLGAMGAATAQSSVTVFGILDVGVTHGSGSIADKNAVTSSNGASSRLGFRGVEDLGGGMSAGFWLEAGVAVDTGLGSATTTNNQSTGTGTALAGTQGLTFNRRSTVSLMGSLGEVRLGRDVSVQEWNHVVFDPFVNVGVGASQTYLGYVSMHAAAVMGPHTRASNTISYFLPSNIGGVYGQVMHYLGENVSGAANSRDGTGTGVRLGYGTGPFTAAVSTARTSYLAGDIASTNIGGSYKLDTTTLMAIADRTKTGNVSGKGYLVGAVVPVGSGEVKASYSAFKTDAGTKPGSKKLAVGYSYNFSKRTALYTILARVKNNGGANTSLGGSLTAANASSTGIDVGIRHNF